jgi:hypothetical protein
MVTKRVLKDSGTFKILTHNLLILNKNEEMNKRFYSENGHNFFYKNTNLIGMIFKTINSLQLFYYIIKIPIF